MNHAAVIDFINIQFAVQRGNLAAEFLLFCPDALPYQRRNILTASQCGENIGFGF